MYTRPRFSTACLSPAPKNSSDLLHGSINPGRRRRWTHFGHTFLSTTERTTVLSIDLTQLCSSCFTFAILEATYFHLRADLGQINFSELLALCGHNCEIITTSTTITTKWILVVECHSSALSQSHQANWNKRTKLLVSSASTAGLSGSCVYVFHSLHTKLWGSF